MSRLLLATVVVVVMFACLAPANVTAAPPPPDDLTAALRQQTGERVQIAYHSQTGLVRYIGTDLEHPIRPASSLAFGASPEAAARQFMVEYGSLFGVTHQASDLQVMSVTAAGGERSFVRFQQLYGGIPVLGGEVIVQVDGARNIVSANGEILPGIDLDTTPDVDAATAAHRAVEAAARWYGEDAAALTATAPQLWIYNPLLLGGPGVQISRLVWRTELKPSDQVLPIRELVLVDAQAGFIALHFNQVETGKYRKIYDNENNRALGLPGNGPVRVEGGPASGVDDVNKAYDYSGDVYDFYWNQHGRDSIDGAGMELIQTVRYCPSSTSVPCPYPNAFWNGTQMVYGQGFAAADDVVGHEMTHGVTDHESHLFYYYQSGAISEAFSDIWGEFIDQGNGKGNDSPAMKWLIGEDLPVGAIRSMSNPPAYNDPDKMTSLNYTCDPTEDDNGGVHTNSGVANKAVFLMVDGGSFNGTTVTGIGISKTANIFYEVQRHLFTSASDYADLYNALQQGCTNLIGSSGITAADCQQVKKAVDAVEMNVQPPACSASEAPICAEGQTATNLFFDDLEDPAGGRWATGSISGPNTWYYPQNSNPYGFDATYATSGQYNIWGYDQPTTADYEIHMTSNVSIPTGETVYLHFRHAFGFQDSTSGDTRYDGGFLEYSTNSGGTWQDANTLGFTHNGYNGTISNSFGNPLGGRQAFTSESNGYVSSRVNLSSLGGQSVRLRFRIGTDSSTDDYGWFIDDIRIYTCPNVYLGQHVFLPLIMRSNPPPGPPILYAIPPPAGGNYTVSWSASANATSYTLQEGDNAGFSSPETRYSGPGTSWPATGKGPGTYCYRVQASNTWGTSGWSNVECVVVPTVNNGINGRVTYNGAAATGIELLLRFWSGSAWSTAATTTTDGEGRYRFMGAASLGAGQQYYVRFGPNTTNSSYVFAWWAPSITTYASGSTVPGGDFDIANVYLLSPASGVAMHLPVTLTWQTRGIATDTYRVELFDPNTGDGWITDDLGNVGSFTVTSLPEGAVFGKAYGWFVDVYNGPDSVGESYYYRTITFLSGIASSPAASPEWQIRKGPREPSLPVRQP
jgi:bacillolysin